ncbi:hypothetical protein BASA62_010488 [Batrachochytrium salamandrivorans]|nr:hypothetical protein BASA62_010488 [Batrachochytrium salamandrivorans]
MCSRDHRYTTLFTGVYPDPCKVSLNLHTIMSLHYQLVFFMLAYEMALFLLLLAPLPVTWRRGMLKWISKSSFVTKVSYAMRIMFLFVVILFVDSLNNIMTTHFTDEHGHAHADVHAESMVRAKLFYAQRNLYLTGSVVFLSLVLNRFFGMVFELMKNEEKSEVLKLQAAKTSKEYLKLLDGDSEKEQEIERLKGMVEDAEKKLKDLDVIKKQASQTADEYMRLTDCYAELERKV